MKATAEFRVTEFYAKEFLPADLGKNLTDTVRKVQVPVGSEMYERIGAISKLVRTRDHKYFFAGWNIQRSYSQKELDSAELLRLKITRAFEPAGLECGTLYDQTNTCEICRAGMRQISELILDLNTVPKKVDIARTISDEIVVSQRFADILAESLTTGYELRPVHHKHFAERMSIDLNKTAAGREVLRLAQEAGCPHPTWQFWVWLNKPEQKRLMEKVRAEASVPNKLARYHKEPWYQLAVNPSVNVNSATKTGNKPFDEDEKNEYRCRKGHTIGLAVLSELVIDKDSWDGSDIAATKQLIGVNRGLLRTSPLLVISQRLYRLMRETACRGFTVEVVHLAA
jgi:hypothetical protein